MLGLISAPSLEQAETLFKAKQYAEVLELLKTDAAEPLTNPDVIRWLAASHAALGHYEESIAALKRGSDAGVSPFSTPVITTWAQKFLNETITRGTPAQKRDLFEPFLKAFPNPPSGWREAIHASLFSAYLQLHQEEPAAALESAALGSSPTAKDWFTIGSGYLEAKVKPERALVCLTEALAAHDRASHGVTLSEQVSWQAFRSQYRSYLAFAYHLNGRLRPSDNLLAAEEPDPSTTFFDVTTSARIEAAKGKRVAVGDLDGDGWDDLLIGGELWKNRQGSFERDARLPPLPGSAWLIGDLDNDGLPDIVACRKEGIMIFRNRGPEGFEEVSARSGFKPLPALPEGNALVDVDQDGRLDLYVATYEGATLGQGTRHVFYRNTGDFRFVDESDLRGVPPEPRCGRGVHAADFNNDGHPDIYVSNYRLNPNVLLQNNGRGIFTNVARSLGVEGTPFQNKYYGHTIGSCWGDLDNDGNLDLITANLAHPRMIESSNKTMVYHNLGPASGWKFEDLFDRSGMAYEETHSDVSMADIDHDGDLDVYFTAVYPERPSALYQNEGGLTFRPITWKSGALIFNGWGHAWLDVDHDGDLDLLVCANDGKVTLFQNRLDHPRRTWLQIRLTGKTFNRSAVGARITVIAGDKKYIREVSAGRGTSSQDSLVQHFGLGEYSGNVDVEIRWGRDPLQRVRNLQTNRVHLIEQH